MNLKYLIILFFIIGCKTHDENKKLSKNSIEYQKIQAVSPQFEGDYEGNVENDETYLKSENEKFCINNKRFLNQDWQELTKD